MSRLQKLPYGISYFLGYRKPDYVPRIIPSWRIYLWSFLASWTGIALLEILFTYSSSFQSHHSPMIIASFGATAVLAYGVIEAPLAQPRNIIGGHIIGSLIGVIIAQLFLSIQHDWASEAQRTAVQWVGGATAMAFALTAMQITRTVHPPAGATALIAVVTPNIIDISWFYIALIVVSAAIQVVVACLFNNVERRYPQYWWTPHVAIKVDPATLSTIMPDMDDQVDDSDDITRPNTNDEEGLYTFDTRHSGAATITSKHETTESALKTLQMAAIQSKSKYALLIPGETVVHTPGLLSEEDLLTLNAILQRLK